MQFRGFWVSQSNSGVDVRSATLDETDLSESSNWQEALQNADPAAPHGYRDPLSMLHDVSRRIAGELSSDRLEACRAGMRDGSGFVIKSVEDLALLIQAAIPTALSTGVLGKNPSTVLGDDEEIKFE